MHRRGFLAQAATTTLLGCAGTLLATPSVAKTLDRRVDRLLVHKAGRTLFLVNAQGTFLRRYPVFLGRQPIGHKRREGDNRTPEGLYHITHEVPDSAYHISFNISYPNRTDRAHARRRGVAPGGNICLHGTGQGSAAVQGDWTAGCVAVTDPLIEEIARYVRPGMPILIQA